MLRLRAFTVLIVSGVMFAASPALADGAPEPKMMKTELESEQVLSVVEVADVVPVQDEEGNVFYNHYVSDEDLQDAGVVLEVVDTYTFEHNGQIFTNKIVNK